MNCSQFSKDWAIAPIVEAGIIEGDKVIFAKEVAISISFSRHPEKSEDNTIAFEIPPSKSSKIQLNKCVGLKKPLVLYHGCCKSISKLSSTTV